MNIRQLLQNSGWAFLRLVEQALRAVRHPQQAFGALREDEHVPRGGLIVFMLAWGAMYAVLHFHVMNRNWLWQDPPGIGRCRFLAFFLGAPTAWFLASLGLWQTSRWLKRPISLEQAEVSAFYLWAVWALMPVIDSIHLLGIPNWTVETPLPWRVSFVGHVSWLFAFPIIIAELTAFFHCTVGRGAYTLWRSIALSVGVLAAARLGLEPVPQLLCRLWQQLFPPNLPGDWWVIVVLIGIIWSAGGAWRWILQGGAKWKAVALAMVGVSLVLAAVQPLRYQ